MVLDTGCPHNVGGKVQFDCLVEGFTKEELSLVEREKSESRCKFGGGPVMQSLFKVKVPLLVANMSVVISFDVVDSDMPLLLGKKTMKEWNLVIIVFIH